MELSTSNSNDLLRYYIAKRTFLFFDEWLFYGTLYYLFSAKYYKIFFGVLLYGTGCIYTSYANISKIEKAFFGHSQKFFVFG